jgi:hypothetical protein
LIITSDIPRFVSPPRDEGNGLKLLHLRELDLDDMGLTSIYLGERIETAATMKRSGAADMAVTTKSSDLSTAELCRQNGWGPGTRLVGDEGYGPTVIEITAVGRDHILALPISHNGKPSYQPYENSWTLDGRDWKEAK